MYFSLITPAEASTRAAAHEWIQGAYTEHQWIWRFFPSPSGTPRSFLFRRRDSSGIPTFYVVSEHKPASNSEHWVVQIKRYEPELSKGQWLDFELRANPIVSTRASSGKQVRHDVVMQEKTRLLQERGISRWADWTTPDRPSLADLVQRCGLAWLEARCMRIGVQLDSSSFRAEGYMQHRGKKGEIRISTLDLAGRFRIENPEALKAALYSGVGHAKAFGCGLMLVRPAR